MCEVIMNWFFVCGETGTGIACSILWLGYVLQEGGVGLILVTDQLNAKILVL